MTSPTRTLIAFHRLRRWSAWVLAWFTVTLAVGALAPSMDPRGLAAVCSATSATLAGWNADAGTPDDGTPAGMSSQGGHCPLCATPATLPPPIVQVEAPWVVLTRQHQPVADAHQPASQTVRPALARGPPAQAQA